jgi:hypothetical protein
VAEWQRSGPEPGKDHSGIICEIHETAGAGPAIGVILLTNAGEKA